MGARSDNLHTTAVIPVKGLSSANRRLDGVLSQKERNALAEGLRVTTLLLHPYMPETTDHLLEALGEPERALVEFGSRGGGQRLGELAPLFPKLEPAKQR
jgi:methionyl-tRNA synthetase